LDLSVDYSGHVDRLERAAFARHLLQLVRALNNETVGAVIGLEGKWGTGKTHVLRTLSSLLEEVPENERPILVEFNAWMLSGTTQLVEALLTQLAAAVPKGAVLNQSSRAKSIRSGADLAERIIGYAGVLGAVKHFSSLANLVLPGSGLLLEGIGDAASTAANASAPLRGVLRRAAKHPERLSLQKAKLGVEDALRNSNLRFLVVIDDLDRVIPQEFVSVLQAIKAVADFPQVTYLLAYDPDVAARSIVEVLRVESGAAYMEKIIQLPVSLPEPPASRMQRFAEFRLKSALVSLPREPGEGELKDVDQALQLTYRLIRSPRDVERLRTRLQVAGPLLSGAVNLADVIVLEALALKFPALIEWIRKNADVSMEFGLVNYDSSLQGTGNLGSAGSYFGVTEEDKKEIARRKDSWLDLLPDDPVQHAPLKNAHQFLFDKLGGNWSQKNNRSSYKRVQEYRFWYRWRCYHDHHEAWDIAEIEDFLKRPHTIIQAHIQEDGDAFQELCHHICDLGVDNLRSCDSVSMAAVFQSAESVLGPTHVARRDMGFGPVQALRVCLLLDAPARRTDAIRVLLTPSSIWTPALLLLDVLHEYAEENSRSTASVLDMAQLDELKPEWISAAREVLEDEHIHGDLEFSIYGLLTVMRQMGLPATAARDLFKRVFSHQGPTLLPTLFSSLSDREGHRHFGMDVDWSVIPDPRILLAMDGSEEVLSKTHRNLLQRMKTRAEKCAAVSGLIAALRHLTQEIGNR
jgi:hypothetical protein